MKLWKSYAEWPEGTTSNSYGEPISEDMHLTRDEAEGVCNLLRRYGFGGQGEIFPVKTWVEPAK